MSKTYFLPVHRYPALKRPKLVEHVLSGEPAVIVIRGSAGTGKSVLAMQSAEQFAVTGGAVVWVRFEPEDVGPELVWHRIFSTIFDAGLAAEGSVIAGLARGGLSAVTPHIMAQAFAELPQPILLVLDDLQSTAAGHGAELAESLIDGLEAAAGVTLLITSRNSFAGLTNPGARARIPVRELEGTELALDRSETEDLVNLRLAEMGAHERAALAAAIHEKTRGWPLVTHSIIVEHKAAAHAEIKTNRGTLVSSLTEQVLAASTPQMQIVLCASAVLDEVSAVGLASMLEVTPADAQQLLDGAFEASLGYWEDESGERWYRHHDLIRDELRARAEAIIGAERIKVMCARAAIAIGRSRSSLAVQAAVRGESWAFLSDHLIHLTDFMLHRKRPLNWLSDIPESVRSEYPVLAAFALLDEYAFPAGRFRQVLAGFKLLSDRTLAAESLQPGMSGLIAATLRMVAGRLSGNDKLAAAMVERVVTSIAEVSGASPAVENRPRDTATTQAAVTLIHVGQLIEADRVLEPIHTRKDRVLPRSLSHATALAALSRAMQGEMRDARRFMSMAAALDLPLGWRNSYIGAGYRIAAAIDALELGNPEHAEQHLDALAEHEATIEHWPFLALTEAYIVEARSGPGESLDRLNRQVARRRGRFAPLDATQAMLRTQRARLRWQSGQVLPRRLMGRGADQVAIYAALSRGEPQVAAGIATSLLNAPGQVGFVRTRAELLLLNAEGLRRTGDLQGARESARHATNLMSEYELTLPMRVLSRATAEALSVEVPRMVPKHSVPDAVRNIEPLTHAEQRAFIAVIEHGSIPAAAAALFLSPETVKGHMKVVYRKLGVNNRNEAIRVATQSRMFELPH